jgi:hypothetical protein
MRSTGIDSGRAMITALQVSSAGYRQRVHTISEFVEVAG